MRQQERGLMCVSPLFDYQYHNRVRQVKEMIMQEKRNDMELLLPDLFEEVRRAVGCRFISDLRSSVYLEAARDIVALMDMSQYPLRVLSDMAKYLYARTVYFTTHEEAQRFFANRCRL